MSRVAPLGVVLAAALAIASGPFASRSCAALDLETGALPASDLELVVVEAPGCLYCQLFRRDVAPAYVTSARAKTVPMRFVDLNALGNEGVLLASPIDSVPTVLLLKRSKEAGRIPGYTGPENFFHSVNYLIETAE